MTLRQSYLALCLPAAALFAPAAMAADADMFARIAPPAGAQFKPLDDGAPMHVLISLKLRDAAGAAAFAKAVSNPASVYYGHYLTPAAFGARFGGDPATYEAVRLWATSHGLSVDAATSSHTLVSLHGTASQFGALFNTHFASFPTKGGAGRLMTQAPTLPSALAGKIEGVLGLENEARPAMLVRPRAAGAPVADVGTGIDGYAPTDITTAYDVPAQVNSAKTEVLAIFEQGGYPASDLTTYLKQYKLPTVPVKSIGVHGSSTADNGVDIEVDLDLDAAIGMNPSLKQILVYIDSYNNDSFQTALVDSLNQIGEDNLATVVSISYGQDEKQQGKAAIKAEGKALTQLVAEGITVFASSGDDGAGGREGSGLNAPDPGSQPDLTSVGGTKLVVGKKEVYVSEVVWNDQYGATGGGVSEVWKIPSYQVVNGKSVAVANGGSAKKRNVPDIAADAAVLTPYSVYCASYGGWLGVGGTSLSSPLWAGMTTVVNSDRVNLGLARVGFYNPLIYTLGVKGTNFHDITSGNNGSPGYTAGPGYDNDTGFGSVDLAKLLPSLTK